MPSPQATNPTPAGRDRFAAWWAEYLNIYEAALLAGMEERQAFELARDKFVGLGFEPIVAANIVRAGLHCIAHKHGRRLYAPADLAEIAKHILPDSK